ncbi:MAG TPA: hypothetical protein DCQ28_07450 [Bacteroidetes bacterium]|nr:hypothetical protein [Bacteroidota bacterium]
MSWIKEVRHDISTIQSTSNDLKKFGLTIGGLLMVLSVAAFWKGWWGTTAIFIVSSLGTFLVISGMFFSDVLRGIHRWWMGFAIILGSVVSRIILFIIFFTIVSFISIAARIFGKKFDITYNDSQRSSYWIQRDQHKPINYEKMS